MDWTKALGLRFDPFDRGLETAEDVFLSADYTRTQEAIRAAIYHQQMLVIVAPRGAGKTVALREIAERAGREILFVRDIALSIERLRINHLREALVRRLLEERHTQDYVRRSEVAQTEQLRRLLGEARRQVVLVLEDGHRMQSQSLINLKRLRELSFGRRERLLTIIILAQPSITGLLEKYEEVRLRSHVVELEGLSSKEVVQYIKLKLASAGGELEKLFDAGAVKLIQKYLRWPLDLNANCTRFLHDAVEAGYTQVPEALVEDRLQVCSDLYSLFLVSGLSEAEIYRQVRAIGITRDPRAIYRLIRGLTTNDEKGMEAVRQILIPHISERSFAKTGPIGDLHHSARNLGIQIYQKDVDLTELARDHGMSINELFSLLQGRHVDRSKLLRLERYVRGIKAA